MSLAPVITLQPPTGIKLTPIDITENPKEWGAKLENPKTQEIMTKVIEPILGETAARLPREKHPEIIKTYCLWAGGKIGDQTTSPIDRLHSSKLFIPTMVKKMQLNAQVRKEAFIALSDQNIPSKDETSKGSKFIDVIKDVRDYLPKNIRRSVVRDVGGGNGSMLDEINKDYLHLETEPAIYEVAQYKDPKCKIISYNTDYSIPEADSSIDLATMNMVLHHIETPHFTLQELHRVLKDGAIFIMRETDTEGDEGIDGFQHLMDHHWYNSNSHADTVTGVPLKKQFRNTRQIQALFEKNCFQPLIVTQHSGDKDNVFYPKFYVFKCVKSSELVKESSSSSSSSFSSSTSSSLSSFSSIV